jgi:hypothetical protein
MQGQSANWNQFVGTVLRDTTLVSDAVTQCAESRESPKFRIPIWCLTVGMPICGTTVAPLSIPCGRHASPGGSSPVGCPFLIKSDVKCALERVACTWERDPLRPDPSIRAPVNHGPRSSGCTTRVAIRTVRFVSARRAVSGPMNVEKIAF